MIVMIICTKFRSIIIQIRIKYKAKAPIYYFE